jgi:hypothetical protein
MAIGRFFAKALLKVAIGWRALTDMVLLLWPTRFIILILAALTLLLQIDQAQDVLYAIFAEDRSGADAALFAGALLFWAVQNWYWARFLLQEQSRSGMKRPLDWGIAAHTHMSSAEVAVPRLLGSLVFVIAALSVWRSAHWPLSGLVLDRMYLLLAGAPAFYILAFLRRVLLNLGRETGSRKVPLLRRGNSILRPQPADTPVPAAIGTVFLLWLAALAAMAATAYVEPWDPSITTIRNGLVPALLVGSGLAVLIIVSRLGLAPATKVFVILLSLVNATLFGLSVFMPVETGSLLGPGAVLIATAAIWAGMTSFFLVYPGQALGLPMTGLILLAMVVGAAFGTASHFDNHTIRTEPALLAQPALDDRPSFEEAFAQWRAQAPCGGSSGQAPCTDGDEPPFVVVAAEGGASRSAYWTAMALGAIEDAYPGFHKSVFALSGVSGGALGIGIYERLVTLYPTPESLPCGRLHDSDQKGSYARCAQEILKRDFLGPTFFSMFNSDLVQRLLPGAILPDRAAALEQSWERAWTATMAKGKAADQRNEDALARPFELRRKSLPAAEWRPILLLNGASVKTGRRIITSDIAIWDGCDPEKSIFPGAADFLCLTRRTPLFSTAIHNSARFPYISPAGTIWSVGPAGENRKSDRIVDGGYFETHGAFTAEDVVTKAAALGRIKPIVISLENDLIPLCPDDITPERCRLRQHNYTWKREAGPMPWWMRFGDDLFSPALGLYAGRDGHGAYARQKLSQDVDGLRSDGPGFVRLNLETGREGLPRVNPAMSWFLSQRSLDSLRDGWCGTGTEPGVAAGGQGKKLSGYDFEGSLKRLTALMPMPMPNAPEAPVCAGPLP